MSGSCLVVPPQFTLLMPIHTKTLHNHNDGETNSQHKQTQELSLAQFHRLLALGSGFVSISVQTKA